MRTPWRLLLAIPAVAQQHRMPVEHGNLTPSWSPDGKTIAFESDRDGDFEIYLMDPDGARVRQLTRNRSEDHLPQWMPDGKTLRFLAGPMEQFMDARSWFEIPATGGVPRPARSGPSSADSSRSRDDRVLLYTESVPGESGPHGGPQRLMLRIGNAPPRAISPPGHAEEPRLSPDGSLVVFEHRKLGDELTDSRLYLAAIPSGVARALVQGTNPSWSPDGALILFKTWDPGRKALLVSTIRPDGTELRRLAPGVLPSWSPDGKRILFMSRHEDRWEIATIARDGGDRRCLTCATGSTAGRDPR